jgi:hypothetical protein
MPRPSATPLEGVGIANTLHVGPGERQTGQRQTGQRHWRLGDWWGYLAILTGLMAGSSEATMGNDQKKAIRRMTSGQHVRSNRNPRRSCGAKRRCEQRSLTRYPLRRMLRRRHQAHQKARQSQNRTSPDRLIHHRRAGRPAANIACTARRAAVDTVLRVKCKNSLNRSG